MKAVLHKKLKNVTIIQGFPGMGLVSTLSTKFILDHLDFEQVGHIESRHIPPLTAIHKGKIIHPISVFHNKILQSSEVALIYFSSNTLIANDCSFWKTFVHRGKCSYKNTVA